MLSKLVELLVGEGGVLRTRALLAFALVGTACYLFISDGKAPEGLLALAGTALAFYYRERVGKN